MYYRRPDPIEYMSTGSEPDMSATEQYLSGVFEGFENHLRQLTQGTEHQNAMCNEETLTITSEGFYVDLINVGEDVGEDLYEIVRAYEGARLKFVKDDYGMLVPRVYIYCLPMPEQAPPLPQQQQRTQRRHYAAAAAAWYDSYRNVCAGLVGTAVLAAVGTTWTQWANLFAWVG